MNERKILVVALVSTCLLSSIPAIAGPLLTTTQTRSFSFSDLNDSTILSFSAFDSNMGILNSVHLEWTLSETLNNTVFNTTGTPKSVGNPVGLSATATTIFSTNAPSSPITSTVTLTTNPFTGIVPNGSSIVGTTTTNPALSGVALICNDYPMTPSCYANSDLSSYLINPLLVTVQTISSSNQGGSVPQGVFTGNSGFSNGQVSLTYDYSSVPEPGSLVLIGFGLAGLASFRSRKSV